MTYKFICIDDGQSQEIGPLLSVLRERSGSRIDVERQRPTIFENLIEAIQEARPDGLIIDLRLDLEADSEGKRARYRGTTVAQDLRTRMSEEEISSIPVVLWSIDWKLKGSFFGDDTVQDLFDRVYDKESEVAERPEQVALELESLAEGYRQVQRAITRGKRLESMLNLENGAIDRLDPRMQERFVDGTSHSVHEYASFILKELIHQQGPLIDEPVLAARLGVDIERSPEWQSLVDNLPARVRYRGVFSDAWKRWWSVHLEDWWEMEPDRPRPLRRMGAQERVQALQRTISAKRLSAAAPIDDGYSDRYWTVCQALNRPLDTRDGLLANSRELKSWQDPPYLSIKAALERIGRDKDLKVHPLERERFEELKEKGSINGEDR